MHFGAVGVACVDCLICRWADDGHVNASVWLDWMAKCIVISKNLLTTRRRDRTIFVSLVLYGLCCLV